MNVRTWILLITSALLVAMVALNWSAIVAPTRLSLLLMSADAPLGLLLLIFGGVIAAMLASVSLQTQIKALADGRRQAAEIREHRALADQAEQSRFMELKTFIEKELASLRQVQEGSLLKLREEFRSTSNELAACIGEIDDRMERRWPTPIGSQP